MATNEFKDTLTLISKSSSTETDDAAPACAEDKNVPQLGMEEWQQIKIFISKHFLEQESKEIWGKIKELYTQFYRIMAQIISILWILPFSNGFLNYGKN